MRTKVAGRVKALSTVTEENILCILDSINCANTALLEEKQIVFCVCTWVAVITVMCTHARHDLTLVVAKTKNSSIPYCV